MSLIENMALVLIKLGLGSLRVFLNGAEDALLEKGVISQERTFLIKMVLFLLLTKYI